MTCFIGDPDDPPIYGVRRLAIDPIRMADALFGTLGPRVVITGEGRKLLDKPVLTNVRDVTVAEIALLALEIAKDAVLDPDAADLEYYRVTRAALDGSQPHSDRAAIARSLPSRWDHSHPPTNSTRACARRLKQAARIAAKHA